MTPATIDRIASAIGQGIVVVLAIALGLACVVAVLR